MGLIAAQEFIQETHERCLAHFKELREARGDAPLWLIEHPLEAEQFVSLQAALAEVVRSRGVVALCRRDAPWLPLLLVCAETGYTYEGTGTDFWPLLDKRLGVTLGYPEHAQLRDVFAGPARALTGVHVPETPWSKNFRIITWPIAHAVLPKELRGALLSAIWACPRRIQEDTAASELVEPLRLWAARHRPRLLTLLAQEELAASLVRTFLLREAGEHVLRPETTARLVADLSADRDSLRALKRLRRRQDSLQVKPPERKRAVVKRRAAPQPVPPRVAKLVLRHGAGSTPTLHLKPPLLPDELARHAMKLVQASRRARVMLWGEGRPTPAQNFFNGLELLVTASPLPAADGEGGPPPLLPALPPSLAKEEQLRLHLEALTASLDRPLLFGEHVGPRGAATQLSDAAVFPSGRWWVLLDPDAPPAGAPPAGVTPIHEPVNGLALFGVDAGQEAARRWLQAVGVRVTSNARITVVGPPSFGQDDEDRGAYLCGDPVFIEVTGLTGRSLRVGDASVEADGLLQVVWPVEPDEPVSFPLSFAERAADFTLRQLADTPRPALLSATLEGPALRLESLLARQLGLALDAGEAFDGLQLRLSLSHGARRASTRWRPLPPPPTRVGRDDDLWCELVEAAEAVGLQGAPTATLTLEVSAVFAETWVLESTPSSVWWEGEGERRRAVSELAEHETVCLSAQRPLLSQRTSSQETECALWLPLRGDAPVLDAGLFSTRLAKRVVLTDGSAQPPARLRRSAAGLAGDVRDLAGSWLAWACARSVDLAADLIRGPVARAVEEWLVSALCGYTWARAEAELAPLQGPSASTLLAEGLLLADSLRDAYSDEPLLEVFDEARLKRLLVDAMAAQLHATPTLLSGLMSTLRELGELRRAEPAEEPEEMQARRRQAEALTRALVAHLRDVEPLIPKAYASVKIEAERTSGGPLERWADPDVAIEPDDPPPSLIAAVEPYWDGVGLAPVRHHVIPPSGRAALAGLDYQLSDDALIAELVEWEKQHSAALAAAGPGRASRWGREPIEALYDLWQRPHRAAESGAWAGELERFVGGRLTCRAVRYVVLRRRRALEGSEAR